MFIGRKQKIYIGITLIIVVCLILVSIFVYYNYIYEEEAETSQVIFEEPKYDLDAISPDINQALVLEIQRIRHRGIVDVMMQRGSAWKNPPQFFFITNIDGLEYVSKDVAAAGGAESETLYNVWDTMFLENKINSDAEEEQEKSEITLKIVERKYTGFLGRNVQDITKETISITYDFKTGRWEGTDSFNDSDGYGHYIGDTFEVWFNVYQTDQDFDRIPYWTEVNILKTDPYVDDSKLDPDMDGVPTTWEWKWGYDPHKYDNHSTLDPDVDGIENVEEYFMEKWFSNPYSQDIYIEADGMEKGGFFDWEHIFWVESQQIVIERLAAHGINVYIDAGWPDSPLNGGGEILQHYETLSQDSGMMLQFYRHHFPDDRKEIFRYLVIGHNAGFCHPSEFNRYDTMAVGTSPYKMYLRRSAFTPRTQRLMLATGVMHELGHTMNVANWNVGGCDNIKFAEGAAAKQEFLDEWGDYKSVMSYYYIWDKTIVDYSDGSHGPNDVNDWELFYLPYFQEDSTVVEDPGFEPPGVSEIGFFRHMALMSKIEV